MKYKYLGGGNLPGIPARDLTEEDVAALDKDQRALLAANVKHGAHEETKHAAVYAEVEPDKPATTKGG